MRRFMVASLELRRSDFDRMFLLLQGPHLGIQAIAFQQRAMRAALREDRFEEFAAAWLARYERTA